MSEPTLADLAGCLSDQRWRLNNLYHVKDKDGQVVLFKLNHVQNKLLDNLHYLNVILKARQQGYTTFIELMALDTAIFHANTSCGVIAHTLGDAEVIFREKVKFPYNNLPEAIRKLVPIVRDNSREIYFGNDSSIRVGTSLRGGTLQFLHVSEFAKVCASDPSKAQEIITGALQTIQAGQMGFIESTAEGNEGAFFDMCQTARAKADGGVNLSPLDWKFQFSGWQESPEYAIDPENVVVPQEVQNYCDGLKAQGVRVTSAQRAWYAKKAETLREKMGQEFPATPDEAFAHAIEGTFYTRQLAIAAKDKRIGRFPYEPNLEVEVVFDLGIDDDTAMIFVQRHRREIRIIDTYSNSGEGLAHYAGVLKDRSKELGYRYSRFIMPHDITVRELAGEGATRKETAESMGIKPIEVAPKLDVADGIEAVRNLLSRCYFDEANAAGLVHALQNYRKEFNDKRGVWSSKPRHDQHSHYADAMRYLAVTPEPVNWAEMEVPTKRLRVA